MRRMGRTHAACLSGFTCLISVCGGLLPALFPLPETQNTGGCVMRTRASSVRTQPPHCSFPGSSDGLPSPCLGSGSATQCVCLFLSRSCLHWNKSSMKARALHVVFSVPSPGPATGFDVVEALINIYGTIRYKLIDFWDCSFNWERETAITTYGRRKSLIFSIHWGSYT